MSPLLAPSALSADGRRRMDDARAELGARLGTSDWKATVAEAGVLRLSTMQAMADPSRLFGTAFLNARFELDNDISAMFRVHDDELARAETHFIGGNRGVLRSAVESAATGHAISHPFYQEVSFSAMADDEALVGNRPAPAILEASWSIARSAGLWWPFANVAFLTDRPSEIHVNAQTVLHREDGPAVVYRDGWSVYAWNGKRVPRAWIMETESVSPRDYKGFDPTFVKWAKSKGSGGSAGATAAQKTKKRAKPAAVIKAILPADPAARLERLRSHAGGMLPLFERYQAGEHRAVWRELVALGPAVRDDPHAADALAVAYETMRRVDANVRTLVERLSAMGYAFDADRPSGRGMTVRVGGPPGPNAGRNVASFEQEFGTLPLSLRAFYEVVGEVNLNGSHPSIDPPDNPVAPDPLLVYGLDEGIVEFDDDEDGESARAVTIAPDDLHKANTSGGDAYEMAIPDLRADGELLNERHSLLFVDYLRLCFAYGGFPGYEGRGSAPSALSGLREGLLEF